MGGLSIWHWLIVLVVVLLVFGSGKVSNLMGEFGKGIKSFKQNVTEKDDVKDASMANPGSLNAPMSAPMPEPVKTSSTINQG